MGRTASSGDILGCFRRTLQWSLACPPTVRALRGWQLLPWRPEASAGEPSRELGDALVADEDQRDDGEGVGYLTGYSAPYSLCTCGWDFLQNQHLNQAGSGGGSAMIAGFSSSVWRYAASSLIV
jgi:hypothetical protein